jgi:hypothetical protein
VVLSENRDRSERSDTRGLLDVAVPARITFNITTMSAIPVDVLREILEHVPTDMPQSRADLATLCKVNKIFCSCSQDVLYRDIYEPNKGVPLTLARSTVIARRVRSFEHCYSCPELATALQNMSLRRLDLNGIDGVSILDGCTFKLDSFTCSFPYSESLQKFLNNQSSLTNVTLYADCKPLPPFDERCLPSLTRVRAMQSWLGELIPGRPVREVGVFSHSNIDSIDLNFFTLHRSNPETPDPL